MKKAPLPFDELKRLNALEMYQVLDTPNEKIFDDITLLASKICETPISLISLIDSDRQWFKSKVGLDAVQTPRDVSFCGHAILDTQIFEIPDSRLDERFSDNPLVTGGPNVIFYAGAPLITSSGYKIGTLCVIDQVAKKLTPTQIDLLESLSKQVITILELKYRDRLLSRTLDDIHIQKNWMSAVINSSRYSIIATDPDGKITTFNKGAERMLGYKSEEMIGKSPVLFHDFDEIVARAKTLTKELGWVVEVGFEVFVAKASLSEADTNEWSYIHKDGSRVFVELSVSCVKEEEDKIIGFLCIATDLSEKKIAEAEKTKLQDELSLQTKRAFHNAKLATIGQMAAGVGHEINNPLGIVKGLTEIIEESLRTSGYENDVVYSKFSKIHSAVERISHITTGLRSFSRNDEIQINKFCFNVMTNETIEMFSELYHQEGITLNYFPCAKKINVLGNQGRLQQVIVNLISNAKDATEGRADRSIDVRLMTDEKELTLIIQDNGRGITDEIKERIFDPFFTTKEINKGTGIGLSLALTIINEHSGKLNFESVIDTGTTFKLTLPLSDSQKTSIKEISTIEKLKTVKDVEGIKILFVDDEEDLREIVKYHLAQQGPTVEVAENGKIAMEMIKKTQFDFILSDITMPVMDGFELLDQFLAFDATRKTKFMFITGGSVNGYEKLDKIMDKVDGVFSKPFQADTIMKKIRDLLTKKEFVISNTINK